MNLSRRRFLVAASGLLLAAAGCNRGPQNAPVAADKARQTLKAALESWQRGEKCDSLQSASPPIYVIDTEWQSGATLKEFQILGDEEKDAHLFSNVKLTVLGMNGQVSTREVTFIVSTAPNLTVSRKLF